MAVGTGLLTDDGRGYGVTYGCAALHGSVAAAKLADRLSFQLLKPHPKALIRKYSGARAHSFASE